MRECTWAHGGVQKGGFTKLHEGCLRGACGVLEGGMQGATGVLEGCTRGT